MAAILQLTTFSNAFSWMKMHEFRRRFHWSLFLKGQINNIPALVQIMACWLVSAKPLSEPMIVYWRIYIYIYIYKGQINNIPALVQIMVWRHPGAKALFEPMMANLLMHICVTQPQWVNQSHRISPTTASLLQSPSQRSLPSGVNLEWNSQIRRFLK